MTQLQPAFEDCKDAQLQHLSRVQGSGVLIAVRAENERIEYCSENSAALLEKEPKELLGRTASEWLSTEWPALRTLAAAEGKLAWRDFPGVGPLIVVAHRQGAHYVFEFGRGESSSRHWWNHAERSRFVEQLTAVHTPEQCLETLVSSVYERCGYDRVMMYRFLPSWDGEVVQERRRPGVSGFLGLRFPASDIPPNVRQLHTLNWQHAIVDVDAGEAPILWWSTEQSPLDLTYSILRSAHPVHIQYLKNMGVQASLTLSIVVNGKLWGLVACHHLASRAPSIQDRLALEEMAQLLSLHLSNLLGLDELRVRAEMRRQVSQVQGALSVASGDPKLALSQNLGNLRRIFGASGAWLRFEGKDFFAGLTPDKLSIAPLRDFLDRFPREQVSWYDTLPDVLEPYRALSANASGVVFIPLGSTDFLTLMRPEFIETVNWAGMPEAAGEVHSKPAQPLSPRNSFAVWSQRMTNKSEPWTAPELEFGERVRDDLLVYLKTAHLERIALHDALTGLANRLLFERRLHEEVRSALTSESSFAVYMIDLDGFKQVNDTLGHAAGDAVLCEVGARLKALVRISDTVARFGGDEFAILQSGLDGRASAVSAANKIVEAISEPYEIGGRVVTIGASVGISICPSDTVEEGELVAYADIALYEVKRSGKNAYSMYSPAMQSSASRSADADLLEQALRSEQLGLKYQPIIDARSGELRGLEAFLRWPRPDGSEMSADEFMWLVEQKRLEPAVGEWVMESVFKQYQQWLREGLPMTPISVNVGADEFSNQDLLGRIEKLGARYETGWQWLRLDIKEEALLADVGHAIRKLARLREAGVGVNLDNFGRGFAPLGYLTQLPFRGIKLDAVLLGGQTGRPELNALFKVVQSIAQVFQAQLTVTRVETQAMRDTLRSEEVDLLQGYAIARPGAASEAAEWLRKPEQFSQ